MVSGSGGTGAAWVPTHIAHSDGLDAYAAAEPSRPPVARLSPNLPVRIDEVRADWARITCANGWIGWVDVRWLAPMTTTTAPVQSPQGPPAGTASAPASTSVAGFVAKLNQPGSWLLAGGLAAGLCVALSWALFPLLALPGKLARQVLPTIGCWDHKPGSLDMWVCSAHSGSMVLLGGVVAMLVTLAFLGPISKQIRKVAPKGSGVLVGPALGTLMFGLVFASAHDQTAVERGIVAQRIFPAVIGIAVFLATRFGPALARRFSRQFEKRDRIPLVFRIVLTAAVPLLLTFLVMNQERVSSTAFKEQAIVLITMALGYLMLVPRDGNFARAASRLRPTRRGRAAG